MLDRGREVFLSQLPLVDWHPSSISEACFQDLGKGIGTRGVVCLVRGGVLRGPGCSSAPTEPEVSRRWERRGAAGSWRTWLAR